MSAAQGTATLMENEVQREIQEGELVSGAAADATKAAKFTEQIDAATATPSEKATVQGQLVGLMEQFEGGNHLHGLLVHAFANQHMAARGLRCFLYGRTGYCASCYGKCITYCTS